MKIRFLVLGLALLPGMAHAEDCSKAATQTDMNMCAGKNAREADAALNSVYKQVQDRLKGQADQAKLLTTAQRAWIMFRNAECAFVGSGTAGGSIQPTILLGCQEDLARKRTEALKAYLSCPEGDLSCPLPRT